MCQHNNFGLRIIIQIISSKLTGCAKAASRTELFPFLGDCKRPESFKTVNATQERHEGTSRIISVSTTPGSRALQIKQKQKQK